MLHGVDAIIRCDLPGSRCLLRRFPFGSQANAHNFIIKFPDG